MTTRDRLTILRGRIKEAKRRYSVVLAATGLGAVLDDLEALLVAIVEKIEGSE